MTLSRKSWLSWHTFIVKRLYKPKKKIEYKVGTGTWYLVRYTTCTSSSSAWAIANDYTLDKKSTQFQILLCQIGQVIEKEPQSTKYAQTLTSLPEMAKGASKMIYSFFLIFCAGTMRHIVSRVVGSNYILHQLMSCFGWVSTNISANISIVVYFEHSSPQWR